MKDLTTDPMKDPMNDPRNDLTKGPMKDLKRDPKKSPKKDFMGDRWPLKHQRNLQKKNIATEITMITRLPKLAQIVYDVCESEKKKRNWKILQLYHHQRSVKQFGRKL